MDTVKETTQKSNRWIPILLFGFGVLLLVVSATFLLRDIPSQTDLSAVPVQVDIPAPELALNDIHDLPTSLAKYRGQVVLVNLWATWCPPCKQEMPALESFYRKHQSEGFVIVAINDGDPTSDVLQFVKEYELTFPVWLDPTYIATEQAFKTLNLPSSYLINRKGRIVLSWVGGINRKSLEEDVTPIIREQP